MCDRMSHFILHADILSVRSYTIMTQGSAPGSGRSRKKKRDTPSQSIDICEQNIIDYSLEKEDQTITEEMDGEEVTYNYEIQLAADHTGVLCLQDSALS